MTSNLLEPELKPDAQPTNPTGRPQDGVRPTLGAPDAEMALIVTIDGPAGAGKSTVAREVARRLGLEFLDTGAMYRAVAALAIDHGIDQADEEAVAKLTRDADLHFDWTTDPPTLLAFDRPIMDRLRDRDVSALVSPISAMPEVRDVLVSLQRRIGGRHPLLVTEGRDQGSVVFPQAPVKLYLDASPRVRAIRRAEQIGEGADIDAIERKIIARDERDSTRAVGPLVRPNGGIVVDSSDLPFDVVVDTLVGIVREKVGGELLLAISRRAGNG
ncbi:MAG: (d)CMP kinase [Phycisphaeraceae bacterium]|nr:(d)CMP kinase [Phycisphaeraceae bacterium]MCB9847410.1 (d)CMP kinase [Phycisphaeraceae bacterium]